MLYNFCSFDTLKKNKMSGGLCDYFDCKKIRRHFQQLSFHHFPNDENSSKTWIENSGKYM